MTGLPTGNPVKCAHFLCWFQYQREERKKRKSFRAYTVYTRVQVERVYKSNPIFEAKNTTFLEKVWFFSFHQLNKINRWSGIQG